MDEADWELSPGLYNSKAFPILPLLLCFSGSEARPQNGSERAHALPLLWGSQASKLSLGEDVLRT